MSKKIFTSNQEKQKKGELNFKPRWRNWIICSISKSGKEVNAKNSRPIKAKQLNQLQTGGLLQIYSTKRGNVFFFFFALLFYCLCSDERAESPINEGIPAQLHP